MPNSIDKIMELKNTTYEVVNNSNETSFSLYKNILEGKNSPEYLSNDINNSKEAIGATIYVLDDKFRVLYATNLFYLVGFSYNLKERAQVLNSLKTPIVSFFDESVKVYTFSGVAPEASTTDETKTYRNFQHSSLLHMYTNYLRGTKLVENNNIAVLKVANHTIYGYPLNINSSANSTQDKFIHFNMNWVVARHSLELHNIVSNEDLDSMVNIKTHMLLDFSLFLDKLNKYIIDYYSISTAIPNSKLKSLDITELQNTYTELIELYSSLVSSGVIDYIELFILSLDDTMTQLTNAIAKGNWVGDGVITYAEKAMSSLNTLKQYLLDLQNGVEKLR